MKKVKSSLHPSFLSSQVADARYFFLDLEADAEGPLSVVCGGCEHCLPEYHIKRRDFPYFSIEYVLEGRGELKFKAGRHKLHGGCLFSYGPKVPHEIITSIDEPLIKYFVDFTGQGAEHLMREHVVGPGQMVRISTPDRIMNIFEMLLHNGRNGTSYSQDICIHLLKALILKTAENRLIEGSIESNAFATYLHCRLLIEESYYSLNNLNDIAEECHVEKAYLCRLFKRFDVHSPYQKLLRMKIEKAAELLLNTEYHVKEISSHLNFSDPYHFSRVFKRIYGKSPRDFRKTSHRHSRPG